MKFLRTLLLAAALVLDTSASYAQLPPLNAVAGPTTSAAFGSIITNETGTGVLVFNNAPTLVAPALGTPTALVLTNATGLPYAALPAAVATGGLVDPRVAGAVCDGVANAATTINSTILSADTNRTVVMLPPGNCLINTAITGVDPIIIRGMGAGAGPGAVDNTAGTLVLPNFASGNVISLTSAYGFNLSDFQINSNVGLRTSGAGLAITGPAPSGTNGFSLISNIAFNSQYDGIVLTRPGLPVVEKTYHQAWKNTAINCVSAAAAEPTCGNFFNNYLFGSTDPATTQIAGMNMGGGYTKVLGNHLLGAQVGLFYDITLFPAGSPNAYFNTVEDNVTYGFRLKNNALQIAGQVSWIGNEFFTQNATMKAMMQIDANSTPGTTWVSALQILGNNFRGGLTTVTGPGPAGVPAYIAIDGTSNWQAVNNIVSATPTDTSVGIVVGADSRNGLISNFQMVSESGAAVTKYAGTLTYTQIFDMQGMTYAKVNAIAPAAGSLIYVTDGSITATNTLSSAGSGVWAQRIGGSWLPVPTAAAIFAGTNAWTAVNTFKSATNATNITIWTATNNNPLMRIYDDSAAGLFGLYNAASSEQVRLYANGQSFIEGTFRLGGALTYGGVTLSNSVTGTGNMVLSASPTFTGTVSRISSDAVAFLGERTTTGSAIFQAKNTVGSVYFGTAGTTAHFALKFADADLTASPVLLIDRSTSAVTLSGALATGGALTYGGVTLSNSVTGTGNMVLSASPTFTGTVLGAAATFSSALTITADGAALLIGGGTLVDSFISFRNNAGTGVAVGLDASLNGGAGGLLLHAGDNKSLAFAVGGVFGSTTPVLTLAASTGAATFTSSISVGTTLGVTGATTLSAALTYGGVTLSNSVTGTGSMVLSASPTFTGTVTAAALTQTVGSKYTVASGTGQRAGNATLVSGTVTVSNTTVTANTVVMLTRKTSGGTPGTTITYTVSAGVSFTITTDNVLDTSVFSYYLLEVV